MAPYAFAIVSLGFLLFFAHLILNALQRKRDYLWYRQLWCYKRLPLSRKQYLQAFPFYSAPSPKYRVQFEHRVCCFIADKKFKHRYGQPVSDEQVVLVAAVACQLSFGRRDYLYAFLDTILYFDEPFQSPANNEIHKGEYNPRARALALSWADFKTGLDITTDNLHLGLHEFTHVMHIESERHTGMDSYRYHKYHQLILRELMDAKLRNRLSSTRFFRDYAFTNQYEFMAVLTEYFFESPQEFRVHFPKLFHHLKMALLFDDAWLHQSEY
jgi:Mlc titration factor MtfA (ptsG expression regulator)